MEVLKDRTIVANGIPPGLDPGFISDTLKAYFENRSLSGGGPVKSVELQREAGRLLVRFKDPGAAANVLTRRKHRVYLDKKKAVVCTTLTVTPLEEPVTSQSLLLSRPKAGTDQRTKRDGEVTVNRGEQDSKSPGAGSANPSKSTASSKCLSNNISEVTVNGEGESKESSTMPSFIPGGSSSDETDEEVQGIIEVDNISPKTSDDTLQLYFENKRRSGGGEILKFERKGDTALIAFENEGVVKSVIARGPHLLDEFVLTVKSVSLKQKGQHRNLPMDTNRVLLRGVKDTTTEETLRLYVENRSGAEEDIVFLYAEEPGVVLVTFFEHIDLDRFIGRCSQRQLDGADVKAARLPVADCIKVSNLPPDVSTDALTLHFENKRRSGGGYVLAVDLLAADNSAIIHFEDYCVVETVVSQSHTLNSKQLNVERYFPQLGRATRVKAVTLSIPKPVTCPVDDHVMRFVMSNQQYQDRLNESLEREQARLQWPVEGDLSLTKIICTASEETQSAAPITRDWDVKVQTALKSFLEAFEFRKVLVQGNLWKSVTTRVANLLLPPSDKVVIEDDPTNHALLISGLSKEVHDVESKITEVVKQVEEDAKNGRRVVTEKLAMTPARIKIMIMGNFFQLLRDSFPSLKVAVDANSNEITLKGFVHDIDIVKVQMYEMLENLVQRSYKPTQNIEEFLQDANASQFVHNCIGKDGLTAVYAVENKEVVVSGVSDNDAKKALDILQNTVAEHNIPVDELSKSALGTAAWQEFVKGIQDNMVVRIQEDDQNGLVTLRMVGAVEFLPEVVDQVESFLQTNTVVDTFLTMENGRARFLKENCVGELRDIERDLKQMSVNISRETRGIESGFCVEGTEEGVKRAVEKLKELGEGILSCQLPVEKPGMPAYFTEGGGREFLSVVEYMHHCKIDLITPLDEALSKSNVDSLSSTDSPIPIDTKRGGTGSIPELQMPVEEISHVAMDNGTRLVVCKGDITRHPVNVMITPANPKLELSGALGEAIRILGGDRIQRECREYIRSNGALSEGQVVETSSGNLPCKHVLHAVVPRWPHSMDKVTTEDATSEETQLFELVLHALELSEELRPQNVALPPIGAGSFGFPTEISARGVTDAAVEFCLQNNHTSIQEIRFISINSLEVAAFHKALVATFGDRVEMIPTTRKAAAAQEEPKKATGPPGPPKAGTRKKKQIIEEDLDLPDVTAGALTTPQGLKITLVKGSIAKQMVNIIVNTTQPGLNLNSGSASKSVLKVAGPQLQSLCYRANTHTGDVPAGEVIITDPAKLPCKQVYHAVCTRYDRLTGGGIEDLKTILWRCLEEAEKSKMESIAFPAIGTGSLDFPRDLVAKVMFAEVLEFGKENLDSGVKDIRFVVYSMDQATVQAFETELERQGGTLQSGSEGSLTPDRDLSASPKPFSSVPHKLHPEEAGVSSGSSSPQPTTDEVQIGHVCLHVQHGNIAKDRTDAIVNPTNAKLDFTMGAVPRAILNAGGHAVLAECRQLGSLPISGVAVTGSGNLRCKHVIHVAPGDDIYTLKEQFRNVLRLAEEMELKSISFPALGTGSTRIETSQAASCMVEAIDEFVHEDKPKNLVLVRATISKEEVMVCYRDAISQWTPGQRQQGQLAALEKIANAVADRMKRVIRFDPKEAPLIVSVDGIVLKVFAGKKAQLDTAVRKIEDMMSRECKDHIITDPSVDKLSLLDQATIKELEKQHTVAITINSSDSSIRVQGNGGDVSDVVTDIYKVLNEITVKEYKSQQAELMSREVQWCYLEQEMYQPYSPDLNAVLEQAKRHGRSYVDFTKPDTLEACHVDFIRMKETRILTGDTRLILRKDTKTDLPEFWDPQGDDEVKVVELSEGSLEFQETYMYFTKTIGDMLSKVVKIERIQNPALWRQYQVKKEKMDRTNKAANNERRLFHGTSIGSCSHINAHGFNRSFCGKNATLYGNGVYFAVESSFSAKDQYSLPATKHNKHVYLARVLVGEATIGRQGMIVPPPKDPVNKTVLYDSVTNNVKNPNIFVIFHDTQAYPEYLITFRS
ncbi:protein mono-ADP-ribosyltransferase PARP14-like isoform X1 [Branchiostoma floridae]|uniref:Poly [ADP-ribose] polymerase n=2 Tax=Branchiostoma floridae TaxID=7739 RepID=A0A9J7L2E5_BRAFL|nr:protein mono-ADP-ribosyltransferase PARP14-like isoform X1 [Branchiostoma floridae]